MKERRLMLSRNRGGVFPSDGLINLYSLDGDVIDRVGGANGTINGSVSFEQGVFSRCAKTGSGAYISIPINLNSSSYSISMWLKLKNYRDYAGIICYRGGNYANGLFSVGPSEYSTRDGYMIQYANQPSGRNIRQYCFWNSDLHDFHHIVFTSNNVMYVDSVRRNYDYLFDEGSYQTMYLGNPTNLGYDSVDYNRYYDGWISQVAIYNRVITQDEINKIYNDGNGIYYS